MSIPCRSNSIALGLLAGLALSCAVPPPEAVPTGEARENVVTVDELPEAPGELRSEAVERVLRQATLRVRTRGCFGVSTGSAFAVSDRVIVTNRHVIDNDAGIQVTSWDGRTWQADLVAAAVYEDLALVRIDGTLPVALDFSSTYASGDSVTVVGYPGGRRITLSHGSIVDDVSGTVFSEPGRVIRVDAAIEQGNSGGPLVNTDGEVVAVVFGLETSSGYGLAIPINTLLDVADAEAFLRVDPVC